MEECEFLIRKTEDSGYQSPSDHLIRISARLSGTATENILLFCYFRENLLTPSKDAANVGSH